MALAVARYVQTGAQRSNATNWVGGANQAWFNTTRKATPMVTHVVSGTPSVSKFTIQGAGTWVVSAGVKAAGAIAARLDIAVGAYSYANCVGGASSPALTDFNIASVTTVVQVNLSQDIFLVWNFSAGTGLDTAAGDCNHVTFLYEGAI